MLGALIPKYPAASNPEPNRMQAVSTLGFLWGSVVTGKALARLFRRLSGVSSIIPSEIDVTGIGYNWFNRYRLSEGSISWAPSFLLC